MKREETGRIEKTEKKSKQARNETCKKRPHSKHATRQQTLVHKSANNKKQLPAHPRAALRSWRTKSSVPGKQLGNSRHTSHAVLSPNSRLCLRPCSKKRSRRCKTRRTLSLRPVASAERLASSMTACTALLSWPVNKTRSLLAASDIFVQESPHTHTHTHPPIRISSRKCKSGIQSFIFIVQKKERLKLKERIE